SEFSDEYLRKIEEFSRGHNIRRFDYSQLNIIKAIGCGGSATVYKADFEEESYAVKSLKINIFMDEKTFRKIMQNDPRNLYSTQELRKDFFTKIVIEAIKPKSNFKNIESLKVIYKSIGLECEAVFMEAMMYHRDKSSFYANEKEKMIEHPYSNERIPNYKHLLFNSLYYEWIITEFSEDSELAVFSFNDILRTIISMDKFNQNTDEKVPSCTYDEICNVCKVYCDDKNFFSVSHLKLLKQVYHTEFLEPLFEFYLPELVELQVNFTIKDNKTLLKKKEILEWLNAIKIIYDDI
ncbi:529_t:CDS:2, partial [Gigaspora rosea]